MQEVPTLVCDAGVDTGHAALLLLPVATALNLPGERALFMFETAQVSFKEFRIVDLLAIARYGEARETQINPNRLERDLCRSNPFPHLDNSLP